MPDTQEMLATELENTASWFSSMYHQLPVIIARLLLAGGVILIGILLLRAMRKLLSKRLLHSKRATRRTAQQADTLRTLIDSVLSYLMYFFIALVVLRVFGVDLASLLAVAGIGSIAIGFGAQSLVKDIISGMFLWLEGNITVGDMVTVAGHTGHVESISLRTTIIRNTDGSVYSIPNGDIRTVICHTRGRVTAQVNITVAHGQDLVLAQQVLEDECIQLAARLSLDETPRVYPCIANDARCVTMRVACSCEAEEDWALEREIRMSMFERLRREGIKP